MLITGLIVFEDEELNNKVVSAVEKTVRHEDPPPPTHVEDISIERRFR
jgi:hypothetical protein